MVKEYIRQVNANVQESYISLILGFLVVVVGGVLLYNFFTKRTIQEQAIDQPVPTVSEEIAATVSGALTGTKVSIVASNAPTRTPSLTPKPTITTAPTTQPTVTKSPVGPGAAQPDSIHTVQKGETLWALSDRYYGTGFDWPKIAQANKLTNPGTIEIGQKLTIPGSTVAGNSDYRISAAATELPKTYTVVSGDSLWKIAERYYGTGFEWPLIAQENKLQNPRLIYPGNTLQLPRRSTTLDPPGR